MTTTSMPVGSPPISLDDIYRAYHRLASYGLRPDTIYVSKSLWDELVPGGVGAPSKQEPRKEFDYYDDIIDIILD